MLLELVRKTWKPLIFVALVSIVITWAFNVENLMITEQTINGIKIKTFDIHIYLQNVNNAWTTNALNFDDIKPTREFESGVDSLFNNLACLFDWIYFPINFALWIFRWMCWLIRVLLSIIGWNTQQVDGVYASTFVQILDWNVTNLFIPYI